MMGGQPGMMGGGQPGMMGGGQPGMEGSGDNRKDAVKTVAGIAGSLFKF